MSLFGWTCVRTDKLEDLQRELELVREKLVLRDLITARLLRLTEGCPKHPSYRVVRAPTADCAECKDLYRMRQELNASDVAKDMGYVERTGKRNSR